MPSNYDSIKNLYKERESFTRRIVFAVILTLILAGMLISRLIDLQIIQHGYYSTQSADNRMRVVPVPPVRGLIYDRQGALLAQNLPSFDLVITPDQVHNLKKTIAELKAILPITDTDVERFYARKKITPGYRRIPLRTNLSPTATARFEVDRYRFPGVDIAAGLARNYPLGTAASHVVGYVGAITANDLKHINPDLYQGLEQIGRAGIERSHENLLRGTPGAKIVEVNAAGRPLHVLNYQPGTPGKNLYLTIDARLQEVAERALGQMDGAVVAIDPRNGEILALVSKPGYNPALFVRGLDQATYKALLDDPDHPLFNRALLGTFSPGSTIKPFMAFAGLQEGTLNPKKLVYAPGWFKLPGSSQIWHCWKRSGHGWINMESAIEQSCDVYFYKVAVALGITRIDKILGEFGFGKKTGVDMPHESTGLLPSPAWSRRVLHRPWYPGGTVNVGIGQGYLTVTAIQLAQATARMAMHGEGFQPHLIHAIGNPATGDVRLVTPQALPPIKANNPEYWDDVIAGMEKVTKGAHGTARGIGYNAPYLIAGKTGTAQVVGSEHSSEQENEDDIPFKFRNNGLFIGFAPADNPKIAVAAIVEHGGEGSTSAAPVVRMVMDEYLLGHVVYKPSPTLNVRHPNQKKPPAGRNH